MKFAMESKTVLIKQRLAKHPISTQLEMRKDIRGIIEPHKMQAFHNEKKEQYQGA